MENTYLTALHGMEGMFDDMDILVGKFHKKFYKDAFAEFYESRFPAIKALEEGYCNAIDKDQYVSNMAGAVADKGAEIYDQEKKKSKKLSVSMNLNLYMVVYILPSFEHFKGQCSQPMIDMLHNCWSNIIILAD